MFKYLITSLLLAPQIAFAGFSLNPSYGVYKTGTQDSMSQLELRVGYEFEMGLYLGGFYSLASQKFIDDSNDYYVGVQAGYVYKGVYGLLGYVLNGDQDLTSGGIKYSGAHGLQVTAGYRVLLMEDVYIGPEFTYRKISFKDIELAGIANTASRRDEVVIPSLAVYFAF
jgi:hypothetical protein